MGLIQRPVKHLGTRTYQTEVALDPDDPILDNEVDGDLDTMYGEFNGHITDANIDPAADIKGTKLLDGSVPRSKLVPQPPNYQTVAIPTGLIITSLSGETTIFTLPALTSLGGLIVLGQSSLGRLNIGNAVAVNDSTLLRLYRDASLIHEVRVRTGGVGSPLILSQAPLSFIEAPAAGSYVYKVNILITVSGVDFETPGTEPAMAFVYELPS